MDRRRGCHASQQQIDKLWPHTNTKQGITRGTVTLSFLGQSSISVNSLQNLYLKELPLNDEFKSLLNLNTVLRFLTMPERFMGVRGGLHRNNLRDFIFENREAVFIMVSTPTEI
ncbi:hypothetical protein RRG08_028914 [Elysia crispata]|uniref:Uncharacterized protein n=1 Tax=Elysia crispata TaxID=231223 RepID=A0AAE1AR27_9GAST|nr:hypothetical protein RRG08_028914 [Elysia crispata]